LLTVGIMQAGEVGLTSPTVLTLVVALRLPKAQTIGQEPTLAQAD
jgi:hypothetical protein